jgi:hypothetical protein
VLICGDERGQRQADRHRQRGGRGIPTYFFAKGMFCGVALILLGKILENQLGRDDR